MYVKAKSRGFALLTLIIMIAALASCDTGVNINSFDWTLYTNTNWRSEEGDADLYFKDKEKGIIFDLYISQVCIAENAETAGKLKSTEDGFIDSFESNYNGSSVKATFTFSPYGDYVFVSFTEASGVSTGLDSYRFVKVEPEITENDEGHYYKKSEVIDDWFYYEKGGYPIITRKNVVTGEEQELVHLNAMPADKHCAWCVDSQTRKIYFISCAGGIDVTDHRSDGIEREGLYSCNLDGSTPQFLSDANGAANHSVRQLLIADGYFYFMSMVEGINGIQDLYRLNLDGSNPIVIISDIPPTYYYTINIRLEGNYICFNIWFDYENFDHILAKYNLDSHEVEYAIKPFSSDEIDHTEILILRFDKEVINESELLEYEFTKQGIEIVLNGIYALSGYEFSSEMLSVYFSSKSWYEPIDNNIDAARARFNTYQEQNLEMVLAYMNSLGLR